MFDRLIALSVRNPVFVNLLFVIICAAGLLAAFKLPREQFPEVSLDRVAVNVTFRGATANDVEELVVRPIEDALEEVSDVDRVVSVASEGNASIVLSFLAGTDLTDARSEVEKAVARVDNLPEDADTPRVREVTLDLPVAAIALLGDRTVHAEADRIAERIRRIPGVAAIKINGGTQRRILVELDERRLRPLKLSGVRVAAAIRAARASVPAGTVESGGTEIFVKTDERLRSAEDVAAIPLEAGSKLRIGDVAEVREAEEEPDTRYWVNGQPAFQLIVNRERGGDPIDIADEIERLMPELQAMVPSHVEVVKAEDYTAIIRDRLDVVIWNGISGAILVVLILYIMAGFRQAMLAVWGMPVSYLTATWLMGYNDISINLISTFGLLIATGIIVDDSIVVIENCQRHMEMGKSRRQAAIDGTKEVLLPVTVAVLTTIFAFLPLTMVGGTMGRVMKILPLAVIFCLVGSLLEAILILPGHIAEHASTDSVGGRTARLAIRLKGWYRPPLAWAIRRRGLTIAIAFGAFLGSIALGLSMPFQYTAVAKPTELIVYWEMPSGSDRDVTQRRGAEIAKLVREGVGDDLVTADRMRVGSTFDVETFFVDTGANLGEIRFEFERGDEILDVYPPMIAELRKNLESDTGVTSFKVQEIQAGPPAGAAVTARVRGRDPARIDEVIAQLHLHLRTIKGVTEIDDDKGIGRETFRVNVSEDRASLHGLNKSEIGQAVRAAVGGIVAAELSIDERAVEVLVRNRDADQLGRGGLADLPISTATGQTVRLGQVATLERTREAGFARRRDNQRTISLLIDVDEEQTSALKLSGEIQAYWDREIAPRYPDLDLGFGGEAEELTESLNDLPGAFMLALGLIYICVALQFRSYIQPIIVMCAVPFGIMGAVYGLFFMGYPLSMFAMFGIVALAGIVVNDSIVMVDFINALRREGKDVTTAAMEGSLERLRPILSTTLTTVFGLAPLAFGWGGSDAILAPMAIALAAGLTVSTTLVLLVVPPIYVLLTDDLPRLFGRKSSELPED